MDMRDEKRYILALDQGTTSSRAVIFDHNGKPIDSYQIEFPQIFPDNGWIEHDPLDILNSQLDAAKGALEKSGISAMQIAAVGITNQRETTIMWDKNTGKPICNAIVWQCRRTADICAALSKQVGEEFFRSRTGLLIDPYFSATKIKWILDNIPGAREGAQKGDILFGTVDSWLIWNLTGGITHCTDVSNAARTMLFNIHTMQWDKDILALLGIPEIILPQVCDSSGVIGYCSSEIFGCEIPIAGCAGDQQAALFGQKCFGRGDVKNTYGTGGFLLMNTGDSPVDAKSGLLTTVGWRIGEKTVYALEGSVFISGAIVKWLRDQLGLISSAAETQSLAASIDSTGGVYIVPAFTGLGAPYWRPDARGIIVGLTRATDKACIVRACLEAVAYQTQDVLAAMEKDAGSLNTIRVDGGASANDFLLKFQADISNKEIIRPDCVESTAVGAAFLAGLGVGYWKDTDEIAALDSDFRRFIPDMPDTRRKELLDGWHNAVALAIR